MRPTSDAIARHEVSIEIEADAGVLYDMISDVSRMGEWSPEAVGGHWVDGGSGAVGDWFVGENETPDRAWQRDCQVAAADRGRDFTFVVGGVEDNCTWWSYEFEPVANGTRVTERWWMVNKTPAMAAATQEQFEQRVAYTETMMRSTLEQLKRVAESAS